MTRDPSSTSGSSTGSVEVVQLVGFRIGQEEFGVDILLVQEIIRLPTITPIPNAPEFIQGVINLRGQILPVIDLRRRLHMGKAPEKQRDPSSRIMIVELKTHVTGFIVDSVSEVMKVFTSQIEPTPHLVASSVGTEYITGVIKSDNRLIILLDFDKILAPHEQDQLKRIDKVVAHESDLNV